MKKKKFQQDESVRVEMTFTKEQIAELSRIKDLMLHVNPHATLADVIMFAAKDYLKRKDSPSTKVTSSNEVSASVQTKTIPASVKRIVLQRDQGCQYVDRKSGRKCKSTFQLQIDHIQPLWASGTIPSKICKPFTPVPINTSL